MSDLGRSDSRARTAGPWLFDVVKGWIYSKPAPLITFVIAEMESGSEQDGHLLAAAHDLLAALEAQISYEGMPGDRGGAAGPKGRARQRAIDLRDAAINKARGMPAARETGAK